MGRYVRATASYALIYKLHLAAGRMARVFRSHGGRSLHVLDGCLVCTIGPPSPTGHLRRMHGGRACSARKCRAHAVCMHMRCTCNGRQLKAEAPRASLA